MTAANPLPLVPDCGGLIRTVALALPAAFFAERRVDDTVSPLIPIGNLLSALPSDIMAVVVIDSASLASARNRLANLPIRCISELVPLSGNDNIPHPWIQDMFHVRASDRGRGVAPELILAAENSIGPGLAAYLGAAVTHSDVALAGGNQLVGPDFRLVGHSSLVDDSGIARQAAVPADRRRKIEGLDGRSVHSFGYRPQDLGNVPFDLLAVQVDPALIEGKMHQCGFHVDQFVSVTGLERDGRPLLLLADPVAHGGNLRAATELKQKLDASALSLARQGFAIERNPVPVAPAIDTNKCLPRLYNNVVLENVTRPGQKRPFVWIPHFGDTETLEEFDAMNRKIWDGLGFQPIGVAGWSHLSSRNGALRCAIKTIDRDQDTRL